MESPVAISKQNPSQNRATFKYRQSTQIYKLFKQLGGKATTYSKMLNVSERSPDILSKILYCQQYQKAISKAT